MSKYVYLFSEGENLKKSELGGKGIGLVEMTKLSIPVPPAFTIITDVCEYFYTHEKKYPENLHKEVEEKLIAIENKMGKKLGDSNDPLLVSCRSGAAISMPGMMDTILNIGLNYDSVKGLANKTHNERFAWDSFRRLVSMLGEIALGIKFEKFEKAMDAIKDKRKVKLDNELNVDELKELVSEYIKIFKKESGQEFPTDPKKQLWMAIDAVFGSWENDRCITYRKLNNIKGLKGTAVTVQSMVFGNMGKTSATGVAFTRDPSTGENVFYGEFLIEAQGEDVVAGIRTPLKLIEMATLMPESYKELCKIRETLEKFYRDMVDLEFTIQESVLYMLQCRVGKRSAFAAIKAALDMIDEKLIDEKEGVLRVDPQQLDQLLHKTISVTDIKEKKPIGKGLAASPGAGVGMAVFNAKVATLWSSQKKSTILIRKETSPEDIEGMNAAAGILTARGGMTSHAAVVARGMGKCCVAGSDDLDIIEEDAKECTVKGHKIREGDWITIDGSTGLIYEGKLNVVDPEISDNFTKFMNIADKYKRLVIKTNADIPRDANVAKLYGAQGIGLCRTEHMFFEKDRILKMRKMILSNKLEDREKYLEELLPFQQSDFYGLFKIMDGYPCIIRLLDPPLHEFLPQDEDKQKECAKSMGIEVEEVKHCVSNLHEFNPMLGFRGCRLGVKYPEINYMQCRAIFLAALQCKKEGLNPFPYVEIPLVATIKEYLLIKELVLKAAKATEAEGVVKYKIGSMIEVPRAALTADEFAKECEFLSFGTNDLTQMTCGLSRDDAGKFLKLYVEKGLYDIDPFVSIDQTGVGLLMQMCVEKARKVNPHIEIGICGEHGGEPRSVEFCHRIGLNDVSCSPYRVPIARLAAAHAGVKELMQKK